MGRRSAVAAVLVAVVLLAGCRPEVDFGTHERQSKIDRVVVDASVQPDGVVRVSQRYTFDSDGGGVVALPAELADPNVPVGLLEGVRNITVDGAPAQRPLRP